MVRPQFLANDEAQVVHHGRIPLLNGFLSPIGASVDFADEQMKHRMGPRIFGRLAGTKGLRQLL